MSVPDTNALLLATDDAAALARRVGASKEAAALEKLSARLRKEKLTPKLIKSTVQPTRDKAFQNLVKHLCDEFGEPLPGNDQVYHEFVQLMLAFDEALRPPKFIEKEVSTSGFAGSDEVQSKKVRYVGNPAAVREIFEQSVTLVKQYTTHVANGELPAAYALIAPEVRGWLTLKRFESELKRAAREFGGSPSRFGFEYFGPIYADEAARQFTGKDFPDSVPKSARLTTLTGYWLMNAREEIHSLVTFWITEHRADYRVAKFEFARP
jgi:hypothetical protein